MQAQATVEQSPHEGLASFSGRQPRESQRQRAARLLGAAANDAGESVQGEEKVSLRYGRAEVAKTASARSALRSGSPKLDMAPAPQPEAAVEPRFEARPAERPEPVNPRGVVRERRQVHRDAWTLEMVLTTVDWVRFGISVVLVIMLGQVAMFIAASSAHAVTRLKDIVAVEGVRDNMLIGYGLVVGLNGTGDKLQNTAFTEQSLGAFLERLGVNTRDSRLKTKNVAAVTVTATLPPFSRQGSRIDVSVNAMGDAKSLQGGTLLATPLYAADGQVYAVAQGALAVGGFAAGGEAATVTKGVPTSASISSGAIVEREIEFDLNQMNGVNLALRNPDVTTATRIAATINNRLGTEAARLVDPSTVRLNVPSQYRDNVTMLLAQVEQLPIQTDQVARVVIDEATGTIVMGENVRIDTVAVAQGSLVVRVEETPQVVQPGAFAPEGAETVVVPRTNIQVEEGASQMLVMNSGATLNELVAGLNSLGVTPRDLITILQTIKAAGALQAEIETR